MAVVSMLAAMAVGGAPPPEAAARGREALPAGSPSAGTPRELIRPVPGSGPPLRPYSPPERRWRSGHRGVDLAAAVGTPVVAAAAGTVRHVGVVAGRPVLSLDHGGDLVTTYEPVEARVHVGEAVTAGQIVGVVLAGHPGCPTEGCVHWGVLVDGVYADPMAVLGRAWRPIRLLPTRPGDGG